MWAWGHDLSAGGWILMAAAMIAFWALVVAGGIWLGQRIGGDRSPALTPLATLEKRLASGEISREEFEDRCRALLERHRVERTTADHP